MIIKHSSGTIDSVYKDKKSAQEDVEKKLGSQEPPDVEEKKDKEDN